MKIQIKGIVGLVTLPAWIAGIVIAKGFWSTFFAIFFPPWGWYLTAERALVALGWVAG